MIQTVKMQPIILLGYIQQTVYFRLIKRVQLQQKAHVGFIHAKCVT